MAKADPDKALASVNKGIDKKEDAMMLMSPHANWDQYLTPAPAAISILGELILISGASDFSLTKAEPKDGFKLLRYPESFRGCLVQISNEGWNAFNAAHTNMDQIRLQSSNVDVHVRSALKLLLTGTPQEVELVVPKALGKVSTIADDCLDLAVSIEQKFLFVMNLTAELLEACTVSKGKYDRENKETEKALEVAKIQSEAVKTSREEMKQRCKTLEKDVTEAQDQFKTAMKEIPSGMEMVGVSLLEGVVSGIRGLISIPSQLFGGSNSSTNTTPYEQEAGVYTQESNPDYKKKSAKHKAYCKILDIIPLINNIAEITMGENPQNPRPNWESVRGGVTMVLSKQLDRHASTLQKEAIKSDPQQLALKLCSGGISACNELGELSQQLHDPAMQKKIENVTKRVKQLQKTSLECQAKAIEKTGTNPLDGKPPKASAAKTGSIARTIVENQCQNARFKTEMTKHILTDARKRHDESFNELRRQDEQLTNLLKDMKKLDLQKIDFETIRATLIKGIKALANLREQWGKLVEFFQMLSNLMKCCLHSSMTNFVDNSKVAREVMCGGVSLSDTFRDLIMEQAVEASKISYVVHTITNAYVKISKQHIMDRIATLGSLLALDPATDMSQIRIRRNELHEGTRLAQEEIQRQLRKEKREFDEKVEARIKRMEQEVHAILPLISKEKIKEIEDSVNKGTSKNELSLEQDLDNLI